MSFWDLSDNSSAANTGTEYEVPTGNLEPIPQGSSVMAMIDEISWKADQGGNEYISARWTVLGPDEYKNRKIFHKLWVSDLDPGTKDHEAGIKKRDKARKMLAAIDANAGGKLTAKPGKPSDDDLQAIRDKPMITTLMVWEMPDTRNGGMMSGNWVSAVAPKSKGIDMRQAAPKSASGAARRDDGFDDARSRAAARRELDDDIPF